MCTFTHMNASSISEIIQKANFKVIYAAPGISDPVAKAMLHFIQRKGQLEVVIDIEPEVCRMGYGNLESVDLLIKNDVLIRKASGLRIGVLLVDNSAWIYSPTPLVVEDEFDNSTNAVVVGMQQAEALINAISPQIESEQVSLFPVVPEIGEKPIIKKDIQVAKEDLEKCPPQKFDVARRVRVYQSYIQFVEMSLSGCHLSRHTVKLPPKLLNVKMDAQIQDRINTTYKLISEDSKISSKTIEKKVSKIRKKYLRSLKNFGSVILIQKKKDFEKEVEEVKQQLQKYTDEVKAQLDKEFLKCKKELIKTLLPVIKNTPPEDLLGGISRKKPTNQQAKLYLENVLNKVFPSGASFIKGMKLECNIKDVTYEMLNSTEFQELLRKEYPYENWPKPFEEHLAAKEHKHNNL